MHTHTIVIGDWSKDGHNQMDFFDFKCSHDEAAVKKAYNDFVAKHDLGLHDDEGQATHRSVLCDYEDNWVREDEYLTFVEAGVDFDAIDIYHDDCHENEVRFTEKAVAQLFMEMVKTEIPGFTYEEVQKPRALNGFWSKDFNHGFGYGVYY